MVVYKVAHLAESIAEAITAQGGNIDDLTVEVLSRWDEFHVRGRATIAEFGPMLSLKPEHTLLDVGCGPGGTCRAMADEYGCQTVGIDSSAEFVRSAQILSGWVGMNDKTRFIHGDALTLPFADNVFDRVITQHVQMNIQDKDAFYREIYRVMKPGGLLLYYDVIGQTAPDFPLPWAATPDESFIISGEYLQEVVRRCGWSELHRTSLTQKGIVFLSRFLHTAEKRGTLPLGQYLLMGPDAMVKQKKLLSALLQGSLQLECGVLKKPDIEG